jgi:hypothetical protein
VVNVWCGYLEAMKLDELQALARVVQPLSAAAGGPDGRERVEAYNELVSCFRDLVTQAMNSVLHRRAVQPELEMELRLLAKALPGARCRAESAGRKQPAWLGPGGLIDEV